MEKRNHSELIVKVLAAVKKEGVTQDRFAAEIGLSDKAAIHIWKKNNYVPERRRGAVAKHSRGTIEAEDFDPVYQ